MRDPAPLKNENTLHETLGVETLEITAERVVLEMPVGPRVHQPMGLLHGGASAMLAESAASMGAFMNCRDDQFGIGTDLNISHLRSMTTGTLRATATPTRVGRSIHVWSIDLDDNHGRRIAVARCTVAIRPLTAIGGSS